MRTQNMTLLTTFRTKNNSCQFLDGIISCKTFSFKNFQSTLLFTYLAVKYISLDLLMGFFTHIKCS